MENFAAEKITGYFLLISGLLIILFACFSVYQVFTKKSQPTNLFTLPGITVDFSKFADQTAQNSNLKQELISPDLLNSPLNYFSHIILMSFIASVGYKIAMVGTNLVRPIKIKVKEDNSQK